MIDYTLLEYGILSGEQDGFEFCYEAVKDDFFTVISGGDDYFKEAESAPASSRKTKIASLIKDNKKKIAIIAGAAVAIIALAVILRKKGKDKAADATKKAGEALKKTAKDDKKANDALAAQAKEVAKEVSAARVGGEVGAAEKKEEVILDKVEKLNEKVTKEAEAAQKKKEKTKMMLPAIVPTKKDTSAEEWKLNTADAAVKRRDAAEDDAHQKFHDFEDRNLDFQDKYLAKIEKRYGKKSKQYFRRSRHLRRMAGKLEDKFYIKNVLPARYANQDTRGERSRIEDEKKTKDNYNNYVRAVNARNERERKKMAKENFFDYICGDLFFE